MDPRDEWSPQRPPTDFTDRVMAEVERPQAARATGDRGRGSWRVAVVAASLGVAAGVALAVNGYYRRVASHGEVIVAERTQIALGARAVAVLEGGAHVAWTGDDVEQSAGDVFYRVEPGGAFRVRTPAGDVRVLGTCFRVRLASEASEASEANETRQEAGVNGRDAKAGLIGAAVGVAAIVSVYEGKVSVSHAKESVTLTAGESARADGSGVRRAEADGTAAPEPAGAGGSSSLVAANENLADQVQDYKRRLDAIAAQQKATEQQLAEAQRKLALAQNDGQAGAASNPYDPSPDDLKALAAKGEVHTRMPCFPTSDPSTVVTAKTLGADGLPDTDVGPINAAIAQSSAQLWATIRPLCAQALGGQGDLADVLGVGACQSVIFEIAKKQHEDTEEELREVAEIRAGERPMPKDPAALGVVGRLVYQMSGASRALEQQLAQTIGPDDARAFIYGEAGCWSTGSWTAGPRDAAPGTKQVTGVATPTP